MREIHILYFQKKIPRKQFPVTDEGNPKGTHVKIDDLKKKNKKAYGQLINAIEIHHGILIILWRSKILK